MDTRWLFFGEDGRLRSGWRFAIFCIVLVPAGALITLAAVALLGLLGLGAEPGTSLAIAIFGVLGLFIALFVGWLCGKYLEGLPFRALGAWFTEGWFKHLVGGVVAGAATLTLAVAIAFAFGGLKFEMNLADSGTLMRSLLISLVIFAAGAAWEEALFRGYIFQTFARSGLAPFAIGLTASFFGAVHLTNPNPGFISTLNTVLAGVWFGVAYLKTRDLWFVWGMHAMWNWMQGSFFGIEVSGLTDIVPLPLLKEIDAGPAWLTGVNYGIEGGIVATIAIMVSTVVIYFAPFLKPSDEMLGSLAYASEGIKPRA